jgi:hypothetical protein
VPSALTICNGALCIYVFRIYVFRIILCKRGLFPDIINELLFVMVKLCVSLAVRTELLYCISFRRDSTFNG